MDRFIWRCALHQVGKNPVVTKEETLQKQCLKVVSDDDRKAQIHDRHFDITKAVKVSRNE